MKHIAIYKFNGLSPSPQVEMKLCTQEEDPIQGNNLIASAIGPNGIRRHREFKSFMAVVDPRYQTPSRDTHPNWKVEPFVKHANVVNMQAIIPGENCSIDEQTIGFQGKHKDTRRHTEKTEGDGFQADSINTGGGFTYAFYFRNQPPPKKWIEKGMSPLHARTLALLSLLKNKWHTVYMDNLYISAKFLRMCFIALSILVTGVARMGGRGVPGCVKQTEVTRKDEVALARGTLKLAQLQDDPEMPNLICSSLYDQKPFYMMSTGQEIISWVRIFKKVWSSSRGKYCLVPFYRLNMVDNYNMNMNQVDLGDQLRGSYRYDHWLRKRKW